VRIYAIGDVHGQLEMLKAAHARIEIDRARVRDRDALVVHLGDLVDRGPDSRGVISYLMEGIAGGKPWISIKGNHDRFFGNYLRSGAQTDARLRVGMTWLNSRMGGDATLRSYGVEKSLFQRDSAFLAAAQKVVPEAHVTFIEELPLTYETPDLRFVHAGIRPGLPMSDQIEDDLLWIREEFLVDTRDHGKLIVHGHTPVDAPMHCGNRVNLDTGAGYGDPLTAAVFEGRDCWILHDNRRERLLPPS
jgi:serine/threonine protein phosphatase 1